MKKIVVECLRIIVCEDKKLFDRLLGLQNHIIKNSENLDDEMKVEVKFLLPELQKLISKVNDNDNAILKGNVPLLPEIEAKEFFHAITSLVHKIFEYEKSNPVMDHMESLFMNLSAHPGLNFERFDVYENHHHIHFIQKHYKDDIPVHCHAKWEAIISDLFEKLNYTSHHDPFGMLVAPSISTIDTGKKRVLNIVINNLFGLYISMID